ncbi:MAG: TauD/TfdA family dioxygenase [Pseudonocardiaceae bacterium]
MRTEMRPLAAGGPRDGVVRSELEPVVKGLDFVPKRLPRRGTVPGRTLLRRDGAVILTGWPVDPDSAVNAAAALLGTRLRGLEQIRERSTDNAAAVGLHRDGANVVVDIHDRRVHLRHPDVDYVVILCSAPAQTGGQSFLVDGYRLVDRLRDRVPELYEFLTTVDVDITSRVPSPDVHPPPRVCRLVEWTRGGRMTVRTPDYAQPAPRETQWDEHEKQLNAYADLLATLTAQIRDETTLAAGELMVLDNYRCLHGVRAHDGARTTHVLRCKSVDAW